MSPSEFLSNSPGRSPKEIQCTSSSTESTILDFPEASTGEDSCVHVSGAERDFDELVRQLTNKSRHSNKSLKKYQVDLEKANEEEFDFRAWLLEAKCQAQNSGVKDKHIGVVWENLTVKGFGGCTQHIKTFPDAFVDFFNIFGTLKGLLGVRRGEIDILSNFHGVAKPGEMVLVLGRPGSGCTSFLRVAANERAGYSRILGDISYGGIDAETFGKRYMGEAVYNQEDDIHYPTLTVEQTLNFALDCKVPRKRPIGMSRQEAKRMVIDTLLKMFGLSHTRDTMVGNAHIRGLSGGERKRVSIAEMMICHATVSSWDNSTRGLDASTALNYAKSLRILTDIHRQTIFVSLYQASEKIYELFDKVLVIDHGKQVYYGPTNEARAYFENLGFAPRPRQTTPDYLTGCTDPFERGIANGVDPLTVPQTPSQLEAAFIHSSSHDKLIAEIEEYKQAIQVDKGQTEQFIQATQDAKHRNVRAKSPYTISLPSQVLAVAKRQFSLKIQDRIYLFTSFLTSFAVSIVIATLFLDLPRDSTGIFTRGGVIFISLLFNCLQAFSELPGVVMGRFLVNKHKSFAFNRPAALWLGQILVDLPFIAFQILSFAVVVYFLTHLDRNAGAFFTFYISLVACSLAMTALFRTLGCACPSFDRVLKLAACVLPIVVLTSGYMIPYPDLKIWSKWCNPVQFAFGGMLVNEFKRVNFSCTDGSLVPNGVGYNDLNHQVCTVSGAVTGSNLIIGEDYIRTAFDRSSKDLWRNFGIVVVFFIGFLVTNVVFGELMTFGAGGKTVTFYQKENQERKVLNQALNEKRTKRVNDIEKESKSTSRILTWEHLCYDVPVAGGQRRLLDNIFGYVKPGQLTALMGASGAGKTTLLDVLANRKNIGVISGSVLVNNKPRNNAFQRGTAYAEQLDIHEETQTVREALRFSAYLRQPYNVPIEEKNTYVEEVISLLEMEDIADAIIGNPLTGLSVEERKRVTIGVELASKPQLLLFLDEPTSGLDSQSAYNIVRFLRKLATSGQAILCTIHQPNASLFECFDKLLLLQRGGRTVYFGDIGPDANVMLEYFAKQGAHCPPDANPAEYMLDAVGAGSRPAIGNRDWAELWSESEEFKAIKDEITRIRDPSRNDEQLEVNTQEYATPLFYQLKTVLLRANVTLWRSKDYGFSRVFMHFALAFLTGLNFWNIGNSKADLQYRIFVVFQATILPALILAQIQPRWDASRKIFYRESSSKMYSQFVFALSVVLAEIPYTVLCAVVYFIAFYYPTGFNHSSSRAGYQFLMIFVDELFSVTLGLVIAALTPSAFIASLFNPFLITVFSLFCGVMISKPHMPKFWRSWMYELNPVTRLVGGMVVTELHGLPVVCKDKELNVFTPPSGQTCYQYASNFLQSAVGYLSNPNSTEICGYCAYSKGEDLYETFEFAFSNRYRDLGIFIMFIGSNLVILFAASKWLNYSRR